MLRIATDESNCPEFEPLGRVHRSDHDSAGRKVAIGRQPPAGETGLCKGWFRALAGNLPGPSEDCDLPRLDAARTQVAQPNGECCYLVLEGFSPDYFRLGTTQDGNRLASFLRAVDFGELCRQQGVGKSVDLSAGPVIDPQTLSTAADVDAGLQPWKRPSVDPLADIAGKEQRARTRCGERSDQAQLARAEVLSLVHNDVTERSHAFLFDHVAEPIADFAP